MYVYYTTHNISYIILVTCMLCVQCIYIIIYIYLYIYIYIRHVYSIYCIYIYIYIYIYYLWLATVSRCDII